MKKMVWDPTLGKIVEASTTSPLGTVGAAITKIAEEITATPRSVPETVPPIGRKVTLTFPRSAEDLLAAAARKVAEAVEEYEAVCEERGVVGDLYIPKFGQKTYYPKQRPQENAHGEDGLGNYYNSDYAGDWVSSSDQC